jgi:predicted permease
MLNMPEWKEEIRRRLAGLKLDPAREAEIAEELSQHLEDRNAELQVQGATPEEAFRAALAEIHGSETLHLELRRVERPVSDQPVVLGAGRKNMITDLWQDLRYAARGLRRHALLSTVVVATLTLGIGVSAGVFTLINAIALRARVDKDQASFVRIYSAYTKDLARPGRPGATTLEDYLAFRDQAKSLRDVAGWAKFEAPLGQDDAPEVRALFVTDNFFALYNLEQPKLGRLLQPADCAAVNPVVMLSERLWQRRFAADPQIIGKVVRFNGQPVTIVGITPTFAGQIDGANAWVPYTLQTYLQLGDELLRPGEADWLTVGGRLRPGFSRRDVAAELALLGSQQDRLHPQRKATHMATDGSQFQAPDIRANSVWFYSLILGLLTLIILITCANVTTLLLSRAAARQQEIAVRLALGAGRLRLLRMLIVETLLLAAAAGLASLYFAYRLPGALIAWLDDPDRNRTIEWSLQPDWRVFAYLAVITLLAGALAGLTPALQSLKVNLSESLKGRQLLFGGARSGAWLRSLLISAQVASSLVLMVGAGLFIRAYQRMTAIDPGYETRQVISARVYARGKVPTRGALPDFNRTLAQRLEALPGVQSVAFANLQPLVSAGLFDVQIPGQAARKAAMNWVSPGFFSTLGIPIVRGRALREGDPPCGREGCSVIVSEELARQFWPGGDPIGKELRNPRGARFEVVGVARDVVTQSIGRQDDPMIYFPWVPNDGPVYYSPLVRFTGDGAAMAHSVTAAIRAMSPELSIEARTIQSWMDENLEMFRKLETLTTLLGGIAVALAVMGIYGVVSFAVSQRTKEVGIRIALGARKRDIYGAVLGAGARPIASGLLVGLSLGLAGASALARGLQNAPVAVNTHDPFTFAAAATLLVAVALAAMLGPARRATRVDPMLALREE